MGVWGLGVGVGLCARDCVCLGGVGRWEMGVGALASVPACVCMCVCICESVCVRVFLFVFVWDGLIWDQKFLK